jgi:hypothetical protein
MPVALKRFQGPHAADRTTMREKTRIHVHHVGDIPVGKRLIHSIITSVRLTRHVPVRKSLIKRRSIQKHAA